MTCVMAVSAYAADSGIISVDVVNTRKGPGTSYDRIEMLAKGKQVSILGEENGWYKIKWNNGTGYVLKEYVAVSSASSAPAATAAPAQNVNANATVKGGSTINVRSGPATSYSRIAMVAAGKRVTLLAEEGGWFKVEFDGKTGYILGDYLAPDAGVLDQLVAAESAQSPAESPEEIPVASAEATAVESGSNAQAPEGESSRTGIITGGTINVRSGPGTEFDRITKVTTGKSVTILGEENGWFKISFSGTTGYVLGDYVYEGSVLPGSAIGEQVAAMALQYQGTRYSYGGSSPSGFDCSGFTMYLYKQFGYSLPHTASGQYANCGVKIDRSQLQPGDLVFFTSSGNGGRINHVAVYIGNGQIIHARYSVGKVHINSLSESYYNRNYVGAIRIA